MGILFRTLAIIFQFCIFRSFQRTPNASNVTMRDFSKYSKKRFIQDVSKINWNLGIADTNKNVDNQFSNFYNKLNEIINKHAPLRPISKRRLKQMNKPWITSGIRKSIKVNNAGISYNASEIPDIMNNHFATIGNNLSSKIPQPSTSLQVIYHVSLTQVLLFSSQFYQPRLN